MSVLASSQPETGPPGTSPEAARTTNASLIYDAFISYSHARDKAIASTLQSTMQKLGKAWYRRRALRLFRDDTSLTATPHLWPSIEQALGQSRFLILMASLEAAASPWVEKEIATWLDHHGPDTVLIALTDGELEWDGAAGDFSWSAATPLPPVLRGRFADEPRWIDLRSYRKGASPRDARFADLAADFAAAIHGMPKEDLLSQEVRQQRRTLRLAGSAVVTLIVFLALAGWQWRVAENAKQVALAAQQRATEQQRIAEAQRDRAERALTLATQTAESLVFDLVQKIRDASVPISVVEDILDRARTLQEQLTAGGENSPDLRHSHAAALMVSVDLLLNIGDIKGALTAAQQARDISQTLVTSNPDSTDYQREFSLSNSKLGDVLKAQGDLASALAAYRDGLAIRKALAQKDPGNTQWQYDLSGSGQRIGDVLMAQGDLASALTAYRDSLAIAKALAQKEPGNTEWQRGLSLGDEKVGDVRTAQGDLAGALTVYRDGLAIREALAQKDPGNTQSQYDLSVSDRTVGEVLMAQGDLVGALAAYREALAIIKALVEKDPNNGEWQHGLSATDNKIGEILKAEGDLSGALFAYRESLAIRQALMRKDSGNADAQRNLSVSNVFVGDVLFELDPENETVG